MDRKGCRSLARLVLLSMWFLGIILRVLKLEVSVWISWKRMWLTIRFSSFLLYRVQ
jgi:hypothetical protein